MEFIRNLLTPPIFNDDEDKTRVAGVLFRVLTMTTLLLPIALVVFILNPSVGRFYTPIAFLVFIISATLLFLTRRGFVRAASMTLITSFVIFSTFIDIASEGETRPVAILSAAVVVAGGLLLGQRGSYVTAILYSVKHILVLFLINSQILHPQFISPKPTPVVDGITTTLGYYLIAVIFSLASNSIYSALKRVRQSESELTAKNQQLQEFTQNLEQRIHERTAELENANTLSQKRARHFEAIARISSSITSAQNLQDLLPRIVEEISEQFGFYHVGIFLNDASNQYSKLGAANSAGGKKMLADGYQLKIGEEGLVGYVTGTGIPRFVFNSGQDVAFFNNPDLPESRSEIALPLRVSGKVIGALDVHSADPSAIRNEDITSLSILADQVSIAIENANLYEASRKSLEQTEASYRQYVLNEWAYLVKEEKLSGYQFADGNSAPLETPINLGEAAQIIREGHIHQSDASADGKPAQVAVPVKVRDEVIGMLSISTQQKTRWSDDDIDIVEAVSEHLALAIENARLFQASASRAARERIVSDISSKISGNILVNNILQTAAQELSQALQGSDVLIQLQTTKKPTEVEE